MNNDKEEFNVVCFGGEDWWYKNRGHIDMQLMRRFAQLGTTVYINSIVMQKPSLKKATGGGKSFSQKLARKTKSIFMGLQQPITNFWVYSPFTLPVHHIKYLRRMNEMLLQFQLSLVKHKLGLRNPVIWVACPAACEIAIKMKKSKLVYQRTDIFEEFPNVDSETIKHYDQRLKANADLTIFVNNKLYGEEASRCRKAVYFDHGVDYDLFATAEQNSYRPIEMVGIPKPVIGFFGEIDDHTFDVPFMEKVIDLQPKMSFVFIGEASSDVNGLQGRKNVWMLGKKPYELIPHYGKFFDVVIMPWRQNRWIEACNPIKLKEYLALGKPVVSTPFPELQKYTDVTYQAKTAREFAERIKQALVEDCQRLIDRRREMVRNVTWDRKAELVLRELFDNKN